LLRSTVLADMQDYEPAQSAVHATHELAQRDLEAYLGRRRSG
jgi:hypothetical protein